MNKQAFIELLQRLQEDTIQVAEQLAMTEVDFTPLLDEYGDQVIRDVVVVGDGRLYIERDGNEDDAEQDIITLLQAIDDFLPAIIAALRAAPEAERRD